MKYELTVTVNDARAMSTDTGSLVITPEPPELDDVKGYAIVPGSYVLVPNDVPLIFDADGNATVMLEASDDALAAPDGTKLRYVLHSAGDDTPFIRFEMPREAIRLSTLIDRMVAGN